MGGATRALIDIILSIYATLSSNTLQLMRELSGAPASPRSDLNRETEKIRTILRYASDGIHILDVEGNVVEASNSFCAMLGYTPAEVIGMNVAVLGCQVFADGTTRPMDPTSCLHRRAADGF
jgi:PAS domain-containing protein